MQVSDTRIHGVKIVQPKVFGDARGFFLETFEKKRDHRGLGLELDFVQVNHLFSSKEATLSAFSSGKLSRATGLRYSW